ncbi:uncharacterized protein LOC125748000 isoform X7 [Brienomyrus brachyistius]|uniref:uncharacterized protein LOC125748000 isoform X7 n=1 Tax=Brienomyrus brachyistius TaxID=42636 RepID=UPI0020B2E77D|nr:uncharacterized protein LOC125748000 isoform X7 [Brienomyrus brachyistius]
MTVLQNLNAYLTERLMVAAGEILEVVAKTILEYQEETARTVKENEELRRRLREVGGQNNLMSDGAQRVAPPVSVGAAAQSQQPHEPQCNSGLEEDREPPQTDIKQEFLEQHESKPEQGAVDLNKQASALACAENPSEHRILQPSLPFEEKTEEVGCLPHMLPDQIKSELDELDYSPQELPIFSQPLNRINNGSNTAESENLVDMNWMESGGVMPELNEQDSGREVCDIPVVGGLQHVPCTSLKGQTTEDKTNASKASQFMKKMPADIICSSLEQLEPVGVESPVDNISVMTLTRKPNGGRKYNKKQYCLFCDKPYSKIARHIEQVHRNEVEVAHALQFPRKSKERRQNLDYLRNRGNFIHNHQVLKQRRGVLVPRKQSSNTAELPKHYVHCLNCHGLFLKKYLWKHTKNCKHSDSYLQDREETHEAHSHRMNFFQEPEPFSGTRNFCNVATTGTRPDCSSSEAVLETFFSPYSRLGTYCSTTNYWGGAHSDNLQIG